MNFWKGLRFKKFLSKWALIVYQRAIAHILVIALVCSTSFYTIQAFAERAPVTWQQEVTTLFKKYDVSDTALKLFLESFESREIAEKTIHQELSEADSITKTSKISTQEGEIQSRRLILCIAASRFFEKLRIDEEQWILDVLFADTPDKKQPIWLATDELRELTDAHPDILKIDSDTNLSFESKNIGAHPGDEFIADEATHQLRISANSTVAIGFDESVLPNTITGKDLTNSLSRPSIEIEPMGASTVKTIADGNKILFPEIFPYIDILHTNTQNGLKEDIILKDEKAARSIDYSLTVRDGITPVIQKNEIIFLNKLGETVAHIPAPFLSDVRGSQSNSAMFELFSGSPEYVARWETEKVIASLPAVLLTGTGAEELSESGTLLIQTGASQTGVITQEISQTGTLQSDAITQEVSQTGASQTGTITQEVSQTGTLQIGETGSWNILTEEWEVLPSPSTPIIEELANTGAISAQTGAIDSAPVPALLPMESQILPIEPIVESAPLSESPAPTPLESPAPISPTSLREFFIPNAYADEMNETQGIEKSPDITEAQDLLFSKIIEMKKSEREDLEDHSLKWDTQYWEGHAVGVRENIDTSEWVGWEVVYTLRLTYSTAGLEFPITVDPTIYIVTIDTSATASGVVIMGQPSSTTNATNNIAGGRWLRAPRNTFKDVNGKFYIVDATNNRVLIWNTVPTSQNTAADIVLGQTNLTTFTANSGGRNASALSNPTSVYSDGTKVFVTDTGNHRVLIWNTFPTVNKQAANLVLGQTTFTTATANNGGIIASSLNAPSSVYVNGTKLFVADTSNSRVLIWNTIPTVNKQAADLVLGQPGFTTSTVNNGGISAASMNLPTSVYTDGTKLFTADRSNHRVLIWNTIPVANGQAANLVLGQNLFTSNTANFGGIGAGSLSAPTGVTSDGTNIYVSDQTNNRVLIWTSAISNNRQTADIVVGQPGFKTSTANNGGIGTGTLNVPSGLFSDGTTLFIADQTNNRVLTLPLNFITLFALSPQFILAQQTTNSNIANMVDEVGFNTGRWIYKDINGRLFVADSANNRVLIWNVAPTTANQLPDVVLGQSNFSINTANITGIGSDTLSNPTSVYSDGTKVFVTDTGNHRVLIWNTVPTTNKQNADLVLGQPNFTSNTLNNGGIGAGTLNAPSSVYILGTKLFVADTTNNRVLIWNTIPTVNKQNANLVLGQPNFTASNANNGGVGSATLSGPTWVATNGTRLFVVDQTNNRVLIWNTIPTVNQTAANVVLGQTNFTGITANAPGITASSLSTPTGITSNGTRLAISDFTNNRVLLWNTIPTTNGQAANVVLGQTLFTTATSNNGGIWTGSISGSRNVYFDGTKLFVADSTNQRILLWNTFPTTNLQAANGVLGQFNFLSNGANMIDAKGMNSPQQSFKDINGKFFVADTANNRVLIWYTAPIDADTPADIVLGQTLFTTNASNNGGRTAGSLSAPTGVYSNGTKLFVADTANNRVLIWNTIPTVNKQNADLVLGQPSLTVGTANNGGVSAASMSTPSGVSGSGSKLYVADTANSRVLVWNTIPTVSQTAANLVLGQTNFTTNTTGTTASTLNLPTRVVTDGTTVAVADRTNNRVLIWNTIPTTNGQAANVVLGQTLFTTNTVNNGGVSASSLNLPVGVFSDGSKFYVADSSNNRVLIWNTIPTTNKQAADYVLGQTNFITNGANTGWVTDITFSNPTGVYSDQDMFYITDTNNHRVVIYTNNYSLPTIPALRQYLPDGTTLVPNGFIGTNFGVISADILTPQETSSQVQLFVEVREINTPFVSLGTNTQAQEADPANAPHVTSGEGIYASSLSPDGDYSVVPYTASISISGLSLGQYKWRAIAYNTNIYSPWKRFNPSIPNFSINTLPVTNTVTSTEAYINEANQTSFPITCDDLTDPDFGQTLIGSYSFNGGTNWYALGSALTPQLSGGLDGLIDLVAINPVGFTGEGSKNIVCRVTDGFGTSTTSSALTIVRDTIFPVFSSKTTFSGWNTVAPISTFTYTDAGSGIGSGNNETCIISTEGLAQTCDFTPNVCDLADNCTITPITSNPADVDTIAPVPVSLAINAGAAYANSPASTLTLSATDATSGLSQMQFSCDDVTYSSPQTYSTTASWNFTTGSGCTISQGTKTVYARFRDIAGNTSTSLSDTIVYDTVAPTTTGAITAGTLGNASNYTTNVTYTLTPADATTPVVSTLYCIDTSNSCSPSTSYTVPVILSTESQNNYIRFSSTDSAGNTQSVQSSGPIKIDLTSPVVSANNASASFYTTNPVITLTTSDGGSGLFVSKYSWDTTDAICRSTGTSFANNTLISIPSDGVHTLYVCNQDIAGNLGSFSGVYKLDTVGPTFGVIDPVNSVWNSSDTIAVSTNDATSGVASSGVGISGDAICNSSDIYSPGSPTGASIAVNSTNTSYICFRATDIAGNISYSTAQGPLRVDTTVPTVGTVTFLALTQTGITVWESGSTDVHSGLDANWASFRIDGGGATPFVSGSGGNLFAGLLPNTNHTFAVQTRDLVGNISAWSTPVSKFTLANIPALPTVLNYSTSAFFVTIAPNSNPTITEYAIALSRDNWVTTQYVESGSLLGSAWNTPTWNTCTNWGAGASCASAFSVGNLLANTSYQVRVFARNGDGVISSPSPSALGDTNETLTYTIDSANLSFSSLVPNTPVLSTTTLSVYTNSSAGFHVALQRTNTGATLEHATRANTSIIDKSPWTGSGGASLWSGYGLGFRINQTNTDAALYSSVQWGISDSVANALYAGVPGSYTNLLTTSIFSPNTRNIEIGWKVVTPSTQTSGTYQGAVSFRVYNDI